MIRNNVAAYIHYSAYDTANSTGKTGDVANHTLKLIIDGVVSAPTNSPAEIAAGEYRLLLTAAETNGAKIITVAGVSATVDVYIIPATVITDLLISGAAFVGCYTAWDASANTPKTGDAGNHTLTVAQDATSAGATNAPAEVDAVNVPGLYKLSVTSGEATGKAVSIIGTSSTGDVNIMPSELSPFTVDYGAEADTLSGVVYAEGTRTGTLDRYAVPTDAGDTIRQQIIDVLTTRFATITILGGYKTDLGQNVTHWRASTADVAQAKLPHLGWEDANEDELDATVGQTDHLLSITCRISAKAEADIYKAKADLVKMIGTDVFMSGLAGNTTLPVEQGDVHQGSKKIWTQEYKFTIEYPTDRFNEFTQ